MGEPCPVTSLFAEAKTFLPDLGAPESCLDECVRLLMGGNFSPFELGGTIDGARSAA